MMESGGEGGEGCDAGVVDDRRGGGGAKRKVCGVCGDKALGYNFNAITCESCKAFFRRNALASKEFKCPFSEQCQITVVTRRFCQKCRLEKCLAIGMVKEYIMSDEDKAQKRRKIAENKARKRGERRCDDDDAASNASSKLIKREENDEESSASSWGRPSPERPSERLGNGDPPPGGKSPRPPSFDGHFRNGTAAVDRNQAVSVIKNNNNNNSGFESAASVGPPQEQPTNGYPATCSGDGDPYYRGKAAIQHPPVYEHHHDVGVPNEYEMPEDADRSYDVANSAPPPPPQIDKNNIIRSILTNAAPGDDASKLLAALTGGGGGVGQPTCDGSVGAGSSWPSQMRRHKYEVARDVLQDLERVQMEPTSVKLILCEAIKLEFETYSSHPQVNGSSRELNDAERARLNELIVANKALLAPLDDYMANLVTDETRYKPTTQGQSNPVLLGIINLTAVAIRRLIKMAKKINAFKNMCEEDQVSLLKGGCTEMMILRSTMTYDCARDTWKVPHSKESLSSIKADVLKLAKGNIYQAHDTFVRSFDAKWRTDENIILIMSAIVLFTPTRPRVVHSDVIELEQNCYYYLLRRYLESVYPGCEAKSAFLKLIQKISELQKLAEEVIGVYLDVNPSEVEPLLIEIFDLKHQQ